MENFTFGEKSALKAFICEYLKNFRKKLPLRLILLLIFSLGAFLLYAFLIAYVNEGICEYYDGPFTKSWLMRHIVSLEGSDSVQWVYPIRSAASYMVLPMIYFLAVRSSGKMAKMGIAGFFKAVIGNLGQYIDDLRYSQASTLLLLGAVSGALLGAAVQNPIFLLLLSMLIYISSAVRENSMLINTLFVVWHDLLLLFRRTGIRIFYIDLVCAFLRGAALGLLIVAIAGIIIANGYLYFLPALALIILSVLKLPGLFRKKTAAQISLFCLCFAVFMFLNSLGVAFAHDGGWIEGGGNLLDWLRSDGAMRVLLAALAVAALCYLSLALGGLPMVGAIKGIAELSMGKDLITGQSLTGFDKALAVAGFIPMCAAGKVAVQTGTMMSAFGNMGDTIGHGMSDALMGDHGSAAGVGGDSGSSSSGGDDSGDIGGSIGEDYGREILQPDEERE